MKVWLEDDGKHRISGRFGVNFFVGFHLDFPGCFWLFFVIFIDFYLVPKNNLMEIPRFLPEFFTSKMTGNPLTFLRRPRRMPKPNVWRELEWPTCVLPWHKDFRLPRFFLLGGKIRSEERTDFCGEQVDGFGGECFFVSWGVVDVHYDFKVKVCYLFSGICFAQNYKFEAAMN